MAALLFCVASAFVALPAAAASSALWVADGADQIDEYLPSQLHSSHTAKPVTIPLGTKPYGVCFDPSHNLWVTTIDQQLLEFSSKSLKKLPHVPSPVATISSSSFKEVNGCTFDQQGDLWLADAANDSLDEVSATQLKAGTASITPPVIITDSVDKSTLEVSFVTFDKQGNLWTDARGSTQLAMYSAAQLSSGGDKPASVILGGGGSLVADSGQIGFDPNGNLWVSEYDDNAVTMFPKSSLGASNNDSPSVVLINPDYFEGQWGLAFHGANLWALNTFDGEAQEFKPNQLASGGDQAPKVILTGAGAEDSWQITFGPAFGH